MYVELASENIHQMLKKERDKRLKRCGKKMISKAGDEEENSTL